MSRSRAGHSREKPVSTGGICVAALLVGILSSANVLAASSHDLAGGGATKKSLSATDTREIDIKVVDLSSGADSKFDELELTRPPLSIESESTAPMLYLAPRVATLVRDVFGDDEIDNASELADESADTSSDATRETPMAPLADSTEILNPVIDEATDTAQPEEHPYSSMKIYREMYRTDI